MLYQLDGAWKVVKRKQGRVFSSVLIMVGSVVGVVLYIPGIALPHHLVPQILALCFTDVWNCDFKDEAELTRHQKSNTLKKYT